MKASTVALVLLGVAGAGAGIYFIVRRQNATPAVSTSTPVLAKIAAPAPASPNALQIAEQAASKKLGVPLAQLGAAAQKAPTWLKVAVFPVGVTAAAQAVINHPTQTVKNVATAAVSDTKKVVGAVVNVAGSIGGDAIAESTNSLVQQVLSQYRSTCPAGASTSAGCRAAYDFLHARGAA